MIHLHYTTRCRRGKGRLWGDWREVLWRCEGIRRGNEVLVNYLCLLGMVVNL